MRKLFTVLVFAVLLLPVFGQDFSAMSLASDQKIGVESEEIVKEINMFNISMDDGVLVHNRIKVDGSIESQIYKLTGYKDSEDEGFFTITLFFKSKLHDYELTVVENEDGVFIIGDSYVYRAKVYSLKTYK